MQADTAQQVQGSREGVLRSFITLGTHLTETTIGTAFGTVEDIRENALSRTRSVIDWVESIQRANVELARKLTDRVDHVSRSVLETGERALKTVALTTRETGHGVLDTASRSAAAFISRPEEHAEEHAPEA